MAIKYKKRIRLKCFDYKGLYGYFVTLCSYDKIQVFQDPKTIEMCLAVMREQGKKYKFLIWAYCFMPDHLHLLIQGSNIDSDFKKFISQFKQKTAFIYKSNKGKKLWQINYYEHVLRKEEDINDIAEYIWGNPVRKGIVEDYRKYPYNGSFEINISEI